MGRAWQENHLIFLIQRAGKSSLHSKFNQLLPPNGARNMMKKWCCNRSHRTNAMRNWTRQEILTGRCTPVAPLSYSHTSSESVSWARSATYCPVSNSCVERALELILVSKITKREPRASRSETSLAVSNPEVNVGERYKSIMLTEDDMVTFTIPMNNPILRIFQS